LRKSQRNLGFTNRVCGFPKLFESVLHKGHVVWYIS
jgi:hypothetical protein